MPSKTDYLHKLATYNEEHGITSTFSEMKKTARRIEKAYEVRPDKMVDPYAYVLDYSDKVGEEASENVDTERAEQSARNHAHAARRLAVAA